MKQGSDTRVPSIMHIVRPLMMAVCLVILTGCAFLPLWTPRLRLPDLGLPPDVRVLSEGEFEHDDPSQPLSTDDASGIHKQLSLTDQQTVTAYRSAYGYSALVPDALAVVVAAYTYDYATSEAAAAAMALLQDSMLAGPGVERLGAVGDHEGLRGEQLSFVGPEGDRVVWFVGMQGRRVTLLMANGLDHPVTSARFGAMVAAATGADRE